MIPTEYQKNLYRAGLTFIIVITLFFAVKFLSEFKSYGMMGSSEANTITLSGHGEVFAVPDIANINFTIRKEAKTVTAAQEEVSKVETEALEVLRNNNIEDKDIKTSNASFYPKYEYVYISRMKPSNQTLVGYEASESITVKVRNTDIVGKIMEELAAAGVTDLSGPDFTIDDEDALKAEARRLAIEDAREKAEALADDLDVRLGRIANFSEAGYPMPFYYSKMGIPANAGGADMAQESAAALPVGENMISSDVTITYEIR